MFRKKMSNLETPNPSDCLKREFVEGVVEEFQNNVTDKNGNIIKVHKVRKVTYHPIPIESWEHQGIDCDMFSVTNMLRSGVLPPASSAKQITASLEDVNFVADEIENIDFEELEKDDNKK